MNEFFGGQVYVNVANNYYLNLVTVLQNKTKKVDFPLILI